MITSAGGRPRSTTVRRRWLVHLQCPVHEEAVSYLRQRITNAADGVHSGERGLDPCAPRAGRGGSRTPFLFAFPSQGPAAIRERACWQHSIVLFDGRHGNKAGTPFGATGRIDTTVLFAKDCDMRRNVDPVVVEPVRPIVYAGPGGSTIPRRACVPVVNDVRAELSSGRP